MMFAEGTLTSADERVTSTLYLVQAGEEEIPLGRHQAGMNLAVELTPDMRTITIVKTTSTDRADATASLQ